jgi:hypothetical protein
MIEESPHQQTNGQTKKKHAVFDDSDDVFPVRISFEIIFDLSLCI